MIDTRAVIERAKRGGRLSPDEKRLLGALLDSYWREPCRRCRRPWPVDHLAARDGRCEECEAVAALGGSR